ncbi:alpha beta-hydrolase [Cristinia sonorae]|uniref:Alpha beta-hydrolase n=1 Tax=Cristinia sonorae TaxID=1940300 RepID=A0A8K0XQQ6_9AGAR|nr:alpha beta-hydrolase [Cristinia sonorae]
MTSIDKKTAPFGTWKSPVTAAAIAAQSLTGGLEDVYLDKATSHVYFAQKRPEENGRSAIVDAGTRKDVLGKEWNARTKVHEYGGAAATVYDGTVYFSNFEDNRVYMKAEGSEAIEPITVDQPTHRYADFTVHPGFTHFVVGICEDHSDPHPARVINTLALINTKNATTTTLVSGADFYACPRFSPDGKWLLWQQWWHPDMPQQSAEIKIATVTFSAGEALTLGEIVHVAGEANKVVAQDPNWTSTTSFHFICDVSGYLNPWKFEFTESEGISRGKASPILKEPVAEEFGAPQWWLSKHGSGALSDTKVAFISFRDAASVLYIADIPTGTFIEVPTEYAHIQYVHGSPAHGKVVFLGQSPDAVGFLTELTLSADGLPVLTKIFPSPTERPTSGLSALSASHISVGVPYKFSLAPDNRTCHLTYYPPRNADYEGGVDGEKPPVVVLIHGGPYHMEPRALDWNKQFWTSRGYAQVDVNYGGSSGFGRAYRESLHGKWGVQDIADAHQCVLILDKMGLVDASRAVVHGGSAGGYAVLQIATSLPVGSFATGVAHYGVSDMKKMADILHKFEYWLCDRLMGGSWEECKDVWIERSPIYHTERVQMPLLVFHGRDDTVIFAEQMIEMVRELKAHGKKAELLLFDGEGHGWRKSSTVQASLEKELQWFGEVLGLQNDP